MEQQHPQRLHRDATLEARMPGESGIRMKRPRPVTSCTHCCATGHSSELTNVRCAHMMNGKRCRGTNQSATGKRDWSQCRSCGGSGYESTNQCAVCHGCGWIFQG
jgi:DnaJ-class molecular chaperone